MRRATALKNSCLTGRSVRLFLRPQGKRYPEFLMNEVMPFVYERYRIARGPENTGLGGSSLGALISLYTASWIALAHSAGCCWKVRLCSFQAGEY